MTGPAHALLSASSAARWLACPPSARLNAIAPEESSVYAREGTLAHTIAERYLTAALRGLPVVLSSDITGHELYSPEMTGYAADYSAYVEEMTSRSSEVFVEARLDYSRWAPDGFGTGDCVILDDKTLTVVDYKYGRGVRVESEENPQLKLYALGALDAYGFVFDVDEVKLCIFQPRIGHISEWIIPVPELMSWAEGVLRPRAELAYQGAGDFCPGDHCRFCKYQTRCKAMQDHAFETVSSDFMAEGSLSLQLLNESDIRMILERQSLIESWLKKVNRYATQRLRDNPDSVPGWKVVEGRSRRSYKNTETVADILRKAGYGDDQIFGPRELLGVTQMTKLLGRKKFGELLAEQLDKPIGKPTLAPACDKRPVFNGVESDLADSYNL